MKALLISLFTIVGITSSFSHIQEDRKKKIHEYLNLSASEKQTGDIKEATRHLNKGAILVWVE